MRLFRSVIDSGCRWLVRHLNRLRRTLEGLYDRLREAIAVAVARAAEDAVREGVHALLMDTPPFSPPGLPAQPPHPFGRGGTPTMSSTSYAAGRKTWTSNRSRGEEAKPMLRSRPVKKPPVRHSFAAPWRRGCRRPAGGCAAAAASRC